MGHSYAWSINQDAQLLHMSRDIVSLRLYEMLMDYEWLHQRTFHENMFIDFIPVFSYVSLAFARKNNIQLGAMLKLNLGLRLIAYLFVVFTLSSGLLCVCVCIRVHKQVSTCQSQYTSCLETTLFFSQ